PGSDTAPGPARSAAPSMRALPVAGMQKTAASVLACGMLSVMSPAGDPFSVMVTILIGGFTGSPSGRTPRFCGPTALNVFWFGQKMPPESVLVLVPVVSFSRFTLNSGRYAPPVAEGGQSMDVSCIVDVVLQARPTRAPVVQTWFTHCGHGNGSACGRRKVCERSGRVTCASPVLGFTDPLASPRIVFTTHVGSGPFSIGSGGPKRQFGLSTQDAVATPLPPPVFGQSLSVVHGVRLGQLVRSLMQAFPG